MTKAFFDTIGGLLIALVAGNLAQHEWEASENHMLGYEMEIRQAGGSHCISDKL